MVGHFTIFEDKKEEIKEKILFNIWTSFAEAKRIIKLDRVDFHFFTLFIVFRKRRKLQKPGKVSKVGSVPTSGWKKTRILVTSPS